MAERLVNDIFDALDEQTVVVPGTATLDVAHAREREVALRLQEGEADLLSCRQPHFAMCGRPADLQGDSGGQHQTRRRRRSPR